jgi:hypothetical protein
VKVRRRCCVKDVGVAGEALWAAEDVGRMNRQLAVVPRAGIDSSNFT